MSTTPDASVTTARAEGAPAPHGRLASGLLVTGLVLLIALCLRVGASLLAAQVTVEKGGTSSAMQPEIALKLRTNTLAPPAWAEEYRQLTDQAGQLATGLAQQGHRAERWSEYADWLAFGLSSLIMILAGYVGRLPESGGDALAVAHALQAAEGTKKKGRGKRALSSRSRFAAMVGVAAALVATATGASNRLQASAARSLDSAKVVSEALGKASRAASGASSDTEVAAALQDLRTALLLNAV